MTIRRTTHAELHRRVRMLNRWLGRPGADTDDWPRPEGAFFLDWSYGQSRLIEALAVGHREVGPRLSTREQALFLDGMLALLEAESRRPMSPLTGSEPLDVVKQADGSAL